MLTPREHLYLFGRIKGLSGRDLDEAVDYFIKGNLLIIFIKKKINI
jgi:ATP-binding cassette subfamily A (ABC1) protein 3